MSSVIGCRSWSICVSLLEYTLKLILPLAQSLDLPVRIGEETGRSHCEENSPPLRGFISCCLLLPQMKLCVWEWPLHWGLIIPYLIKKEPFTPCLRGNPGTRSPFPLQGSLSSHVWEPGCGCPHLQFLCQRSGVFGTGRPRTTYLLGHSMAPATASEFLLPLGCYLGSACPAIPAAAPKFLLRPILTVQPVRQYRARGTGAGWRHSAPCRRGVVRVAPCAARSQQRPWWLCLELQPRPEQVGPHGSVRAGVGLGQLLGFVCLSAHTHTHKELL